MKFVSFPGKRSVLVRFRDTKFKGRIQTRDSVIVDESELFETILKK